MQRLWPANGGYARHCGKSTVISLAAAGSYCEDQAQAKPYISTDELTTLPFVPVCICTLLVERLKYIAIKRAQRSNEEFCALAFFCKAAQAHNKPCLAATQLFVPVPENLYDSCMDTCCGIELLNLCGAEGVDAHLLGAFAPNMGRLFLEQGHAHAVQYSTVAARCSRARHLLTPRVQYLPIYAERHAINRQVLAVWLPSPRRRRDALRACAGDRIQVGATELRLHSPRE